ncbi:MULTISPECIES: hypothetical protein [Paraburkholderia]|uniref:LysR family transcriptional regulator n=1 Tax=Paraburkholderia madseniana TaxID=2599607 RepID=A0ABT3U8H8_9BURK|nr:MULTISPECIES: hypothetical protein [Paraburkholderia]MCX4145052.1 hypothetical protein [Paraburkholderia madseniana]
MTTIVQSFSERYPDVNISLLERDSLTIAKSLADACLRRCDV